MDQKKNNSIAIVSIIVLVLVVAYFGYGQYTKKMSVTPSIDNTQTTPTTGTVPSGSKNPGSDSTSGGIDVSVSVGHSYKDGSYTAVGQYYSPGGSEQLKVALTLKGDVVTDVAVTPLATRPESKMWQTKVAGNIKNYVVGKKLNDVSITKVSGSSLTPKGFMDAVSKIKAEAAA